MSVKVVVNRCFGGYSLSEAAMKALGVTSPYAFAGDRANPELVRVVEELGCAAASGPLAELEVVEIPADTDWRIDDYDGRETVSEGRQW